MSCGRHEMPAEPKVHHVDGSTFYVDHTGFMSGEGSMVLRLLEHMMGGPCTLAGDLGGTSAYYCRPEIRGMIRKSPPERHGDQYLEITIKLWKCRPDARLRPAGEPDIEAEFEADDAANAEDLEGSHIEHNGCGGLDD